MLEIGLLIERYVENSEIDPLKARKGGRRRKEKREGQTFFKICKILRSPSSFKVITRKNGYSRLVSTFSRRGRLQKSSIERR